MEITLTSFRVGRMSLVDSKLQSDPRKGLLKLVKSDDELVHIQWYLRNSDGSTSTEPEDDVVVFPGECMMEKMSHGRFLLLKFVDDQERNMFFWLQETAVDKDMQLVENFNSSLEGAADMEVTPAAPAPAPPAAPAAAPTPAAPAAAPTPAASSAASAPASGQADLASLLSMALAGAGAPPAAAPGPSSTDALAQSLLAQLMGGQPFGQGGGMMMQRRQDVGPSLTKVLSTDVLLQLFKRPGMLERLAPHLPEEQCTQALLEELASSPPFRQQLAAFSGAIQSGQLDLAQLGLPSARGFSIADFLEAIAEDVERDKKRKQQTQQQE
eukprot:gene20656-27442_t